MKKSTMNLAISLLIGASMAHAQPPSYEEGIDSDLVEAITIGNVKSVHQALKRGANPGISHDHKRVWELFGERIHRTQKAPILNLLKKFGIKKLKETKKCPGCYLADVDLKGENLSSADLNDANLTDANFSDANLTGADFNRAILINANLEGAQFHAGAFFQYANLAHANLARVDATGSNFSNANLTDANFSDANLTGVYFEGANLKDATFEGAENLYTTPMDAIYFSAGPFSDKGANCDQTTWEDGSKRCGEGCTKECEEISSKEEKSKSL